MAYDGSASTIVLFQVRWQGGIPIAETWTLAGHVWTQANPQHSPSPRSDAGIAYDGVRHNVVLFGGLPTPASSAGLADTWTWDGAD